MCALWSPAGKGLPSWLSLVVSNCKFVTFPLLPWVRCGTWLYRFLIFAPLLTLLTYDLLCCGCSTKSRSWSTRLCFCGNTYSCCGWSRSWFCCGNWGDWFCCRNSGGWFRCGNSGGWFCCGNSGGWFCCGNSSGWFCCGNSSGSYWNSYNFMHYILMYE